MRYLFDNDFVVRPPECIGRAWMPAWQRWLSDLLCRWTGHLLWRPGTSVVIMEHSLPHRVTLCRRCFKAGYVRGDYVQQGS
jgi:hypothetical protein